MSVYGGVPIEASVECGVEFPWGSDVGIALENVGDFVGILSADAAEGELGESASFAFRELEGARAWLIE